MELTEDQIKDLKKYSLVLNALNLEDGVKWDYRYSDEWEELDGPYYGSKSVNELNFLPKKIEDLFEVIRDNFNTENFYNDYYDSYNGSLDFFIVAKDTRIIINYTNYSMEHESTSINKTFQELVDQPTPWWSQETEKAGSKLLDPEYVNELKNKYGDNIEVTYDGSGDEGWINDQMDTSNGRFTLEGDLEKMMYRILDLFHGGWENNEGSNGTISLNFNDGVIYIEHWMNYEQENDNHYMTLNF